MRRHHNGSGRRPVIPADWAAHHRPVAEGTMTGTCEIRHPGGTTSFDPATGTRDTVPHPPHHTGPARLQARPAETSAGVAGEQQITTYEYLVVVDLDGSADTKVGDLVTVTAVDDNGDAALVGQMLTVTGVSSGSLAWERDLICSDYQG